MYVRVMISNNNLKVFIRIFFFQTVLSTCLPWLAQQPNLFKTFMSLREEIARVYDELRDEELNDDKDLVLSHRLLNHSFIYKLLCASNKFVSKNMTDLLRNILKDRYETT